MHKRASVIGLLTALVLVVGVLGAYSALAKPELQSSALQVQMTALSSGDEVLYTINLVNTGSSSISQVYIAGTVPTGASFVGATQTPSDSWFRGKEGDSAVWLSNGIPAQGSQGPFKYKVKVSDGKVGPAHSWVHWQLSADGIAQSGDVTPLTLPTSLAGLPMENFRNDWPFDPPLPDHLWMDIGADRLIFLHFDKPVAEATRILYMGEGVKGRFFAEDQPDGGTTGFTHFHRFKAPTVEAGHGGAPGDEGYWLRHVALSEFEMMGMKVRPGIDYNFMPTVASVGLKGQWRNEWPFDPPLPDHLWMDLGGGRILFLHYDKPVTDSTKMLIYVGDGVRGRFCASDQPNGGKTGYVHFHRFKAPTVEAGHGGAPGDDGYWLRHIAVSEFEMMGMKVKPGIDYNFMPTSAPQCAGTPASASATGLSMPATTAATNGVATGSQPASPPAAASAGPATEGERIFGAIGCIGCHTVKGTGGNVGPNLSDIGARRDKAYIEQSIREPQTYVVPGYPPVMPSPDKLGLSDQDIANLVEFLTRLK
ncbi:MAG: c-type cytochrome [Dehalococcoidia bacterium]|nr:c-type cytochrome [Dehalococcoidia bacterium]